MNAPVRPPERKPLDREEADRAIGICRAEGVAVTARGGGTSQAGQTVNETVVLDCSRVRRADKPLVHLLLACLEEALKRNGDVRLAGIRQEVWPSLQTAGVARLFRVFPTTAEAVNSFSRLAAGQRTTVYPDRPAANAA